MTAARRRHLVMVRNDGSAIPDLPRGAWALVGTFGSEGEARSRYFGLRTFLESRDLACLVVESVQPPLGPEEVRILISRGPSPEKGRVPDAVRLSREQQDAFDRAATAYLADAPALHGMRHARVVHAGVWASALAGAVLVLVGGTAISLTGRGTGAGGAVVADAGTPGGALVAIPDGAGDSFVVFRILPDGTRSDARRVSRGELDAMKGVRRGPGAQEEPSAASRTSSLAERATAFVRFRAPD